MNRSEFIITTAIILFVAFCVGWFANWLVHRFTRLSQSDIGELEKMSKSLHDAEESVSYTHLTLPTNREV